MTKKRKKAGDLIPVGEFEGWMETLDIMADLEEAAAIREALRAKDDVVSLERP